MFSPRRNFDIDAGDGAGVGGNVGLKLPKSHKNNSYENCLHFWDIAPKISKNTFKISSYIQKMTPNSINAFKK